MISNVDIAVQISSALWQIELGAKEWMTQQKKQVQIRIGRIFLSIQISVPEVGKTVNKNTNEGPKESLAGAAKFKVIATFSVESAAHR